MTRTAALRRCNICGEMRPTVTVETDAGPVELIICARCDRPDAPPWPKRWGRRGD